MQRLRELRRARRTCTGTGVRAMLSGREYYLTLLGCKCVQPHRADNPRRQPNDCDFYDDTKGCLIAIPGEYGGCM